MRPLAIVLAAGVTTQAQANSSPWYWATTVITETFWTICGAEDVATIHEECPPSTSIILDDGVVTGITVQRASSPTSCYSLPIPTSSLEVVAFDAKGVSGTGDAGPVFFYVGDNATTPEYVSTTIDGKRCILDMSSNASAAGRMALSIAGGESLLFDEAGLHLFDADCNTVSSVAISSFLDQLTSVANQPPPPSGPRKAALSAHRNAASGSNFTVAVQVDDIVGGQLVEPYLAFGPSPCTFLSREHGTQWDNLTWNCEYPGANSAVRSCENSFHTWLQPSSRASAADHSDNTTTTDCDILFKYIPGFLSHARESIADLMPGLSQPLLDGMRWVTTAQAAVQDAAEAGGGALCGILHIADQYEILFSDPGLPSPHTIGVYRSPPVPTIVGTVASRTTRMTKEPARQINPTVSDFSTVTATSFPVLPIGALTGLLGGIGSAFGAGGVAKSVTATGRAGQATPANTPATTAGPSSQLLVVGTSPVTSIFVVGGVRAVAN